MTFSANGKYLISGHYEGVQLWRVQDGEEIARLEADCVWCLAVSKDNNWIAAGTFWGYVIVWDANTHKQKYCLKTKAVYGLDFSPDAARLVAASNDSTATIWDIGTGDEVRKLVHEDWVRATKYSPEGNRIATATSHHVRVWDSEDGRLMHEIQVSWSYPTGLFWVYNLLFVVSEDKVWEIKGTTVLEWSTPESK